MKQTSAVRVPDTKKPYEQKRPEMPKSILSFFSLVVSAMIKKMTADAAIVHPNVAASEKNEK